MSGADGCRVRFAVSAEDLRRSQALRHRRFRGDGEGLDRDAFDGRAAHVLVEEATGRLVCCFRLLRLKDGSEIGSSYSAQFYDLAKFARYPGPMLEMGRFCVEADARHTTAVLRLAWGAVAAHVEANGIELIFGCSSFAGVKAEIHANAFALLKDRYLAPRRWRPQVKAPSVFRFADLPGLRPSDPRAGMRAMPPLLRTYLAMGGWVSDHAVVDNDLGTLHVFTGLETRAMLPTRALPPLRPPQGAPTVRLGESPEPRGGTPQELSKSGWSSR